MRGASKIQDLIAENTGLDVVFNSWSKSVILSATVLFNSVPPIAKVSALTSILPNEPVEVIELLTFPVAVISSSDKSPLAVKLPVTLIESLKSIL